MARYRGIVFERFSDRARWVVVQAQEEARLLNHSYIGTEHILLGLLCEEDGVAVQALNALGVERGPVRVAVDEIIGRGLASPSGHLPFTPRAKKVLELSLRESLMLGHDYIGEEHILLGLLREGEGVACHVLMQMGANQAAVRSQLAELAGLDPAVLDQPLPRRSRDRPGAGWSLRCKHPDESLRIAPGVGLRTVRCLKCGELVGILPAAEAG